MFSLMVSCVGVFPFVFVCSVCSCSAWNIMSVITPHFFAGGATLLGLQLLLKDQLQRKKTAWFQRQLTLELVLLLAVCLFADEFVLDIDVDLCLSMPSLLFVML